MSEFSEEWDSPEEQQQQGQEAQEIESFEDYFDALEAEDSSGVIKIDMSRTIKGAKEGSVVFVFKSPDIRQVFRFQEISAQKAAKSAVPVSLIYQLTLLSETYLSPPMGGDKFEWFKKLAKKNATAFAYLVQMYYLTNPISDIEKAAQEKKKGLKGRSTNSS